MGLYPIDESPSAWEKNTAIRESEKTSETSSPSKGDSDWFTGIRTSIGRFFCSLQLGTKSDGGAGETTHSTASSTGARSMKDLLKNSMKILSYFFGNAHQSPPSEQAVNQSLLKALDSQHAAAASPTEENQKKAQTDLQEARAIVQRFLEGLASSGKTLDSIKEGTFLGELRGKLKLTPSPNQVNQTDQTAKINNWNAVSTYILRDESKSLHLTLEKILSSREREENNTPLYLRLDPNKGLYLSSDNSEPTTYLARSSENRAVAQRIIELTKEQCGGKIAADMERHLHSKYHSECELITLDDVRDCLLESFSKILSLPAIARSTKLKKEALTEFINTTERIPNQSPDQTTVYTSDEKVVLSEIGTQLSCGVGMNSGKPLDATLPAAFCAVFGKTMRETLLTDEKAGMLRPLNESFEKLKLPNEDESKTENKTKQSLLRELTRVTIQFQNENNNPETINSAQSKTTPEALLKEFEQKIKHLTGTPPSEQQINEILSLISTNVRTAGTPLKATEESGVVLYRSGNANTKEKITISYKKETGKFIIERRVEGPIEKFSSSALQSAQTKLTYSILPKNDSTQTSQMYGMSAYTLEYTPPPTDTNNSTNTPIASRLEIIDSREGFYFKDLPQSDSATEKI